MDDSEAPFTADAIMLTPGSFGWNVMTQRNPLIIKDILEAFEYPTVTKSALAELANPFEMVVGERPSSGPDLKFWEAQIQFYDGRKLLDLPFVWAENYFYRLVIEATKYLEKGDWNEVDPFAKMKEPSWNSQMSEMTEAFQKSKDPYEKLSNAIFTTVVGNGADLGFQAGVKGGIHEKSGFSNLVIDHVKSLSEFVMDGKAREIVVVCDNTGEELLADLLLGIVILENGWADRIVYQLKPWPYFVSDAIQKDFDQLVEDGPDWFRQSVGSLMRAGKLATETSYFHVQPLEFREVPELLNAWNQKDLVLFKGDLNYRKLVGDRQWEPTAPFEEITSFLTVPIAALRLLKSDVLVGADEDSVEKRNQVSDTWRVDGSVGVVQCAVKNKEVSPGT